MYTLKLPIETDIDTKISAQIKSMMENDNPHIMRLQCITWKPVKTLTRQLHGWRKHHKTQLLSGFSIKSKERFLCTG